MAKETKPAVRNAEPESIETIIHEVRQSTEALLEKIPEEYREVAGVLIGALDFLGPSLQNTMSDGKAQMEERNRLLAQIVGEQKLANVRLVAILQGLQIQDPAAQPKDNKLKHDERERVRRSLGG